MAIFDLGQLQTVFELGLITSLTVLALFLSYTMLNVCDLSTDGCFTFGAAVGAIVALNGHPILSIPAAMLAGIVSGFVVAILQTVLGIDSLLAGIVSIRATGNNPDMVKSSSINPVITTIIGLCIANSFTALSGCLLAQSQKQSEINIGTGMVTVALASLLIGGVFVKRGKIPLRIIGAVLGAIIFRLVYQIAIGLHMPPFMLKLVSSVIVIIAIAGPYLKAKMPEYIRKAKIKSGGKK